ncbi:MAG: glycyl-radical enzyme activating protein [Desulfosarcinaceae bacterium]
MTSGRILRIEKLSSYDGDGLRTVVFLKGCPLRCQWCSTPESHEMVTDFGVRQAKCTHCFTCVENCPETAITYDADQDLFVTDMDRCSDCRQCIDGCLAGARTAYGYTATAEEILQEVAKDSVFYYHSGGGVTVSGGEPFLQAAFLRELLEGCLLQGINTAVETCGHVAWGAIEGAVPFIDTLFYDLKHTDDATHKRLTGAGNHLITENLLKIDRTAKALDIIVRMPVVPGINDDDANLRTLGEVCLKLKNLEEIQLLPYHRLGIETYCTLSRPYALEHVPAAEEETLMPKIELLKQMGLPVRIGSY